MTESTSPSTPDAIGGFEPPDRRVAYRMRGSSTAADSWVTTSLGFAIRLDEVLLSVAALEMVPCETGSDIARRWSALGPPRARATHPDLQDISKAEPGVAVDLLSDDVSELADADTTEGPYCWVHLLATPSGDDVVDGASVAVRGQWKDAGGREGSFDGAVPLTFGRSLPLLPGASLADGTPQVVLALDPMVALDSLDPSALDDAELAWEFLKQLIETTAASYHMPD